MRRAPRLQHVLQARSPHDRDPLDPGPPRQPEQHPPDPRVRRILNNKISGDEPRLLQHRPRRQRVDRQHRQLLRGQPRRQREQPARGHHHPLGPRPAVDQHAVADIGNTPLVLLRSLGRGLPVPVLVKCEHMNPGGSVKDRIALAIVDDAEARGLLRRARRSSRPPPATPASASRSWPRRAATSSCA
jgi:hypothetical protein